MKAYLHSWLTSTDYLLSAALPLQADDPERPRMLDDGRFVSRGSTCMTWTPAWESSSASVYRLTACLPWSASDCWKWPTSPP